MMSEPRVSEPSLTTEIDKEVVLKNHDRYMTEFRVNQCLLFSDHKCPYHRPYLCFDWHFTNQRRRPSKITEEGSYNYDADIYCSKYDEASGECGNGDECPYLHKTAGDTEKKYHHKNYKTLMCPYETNGEGVCSGHGDHCPYAHGDYDLRKPQEVKEIKDLKKDANYQFNKYITLHHKAMEGEGTVVEDPRWESIAYTYAFYKTDPCKISPRLCKQGYACPYYHNSRDKRRSPQIFLYRSAPCPNVKVNEEWGPPMNCSLGDECTLSHTRVEQQFHLDVYKSSKCNDVIQSGYCPRTVFCAFSHSDEEINGLKELKTNLEQGEQLSTFLKKFETLKTSDGSGKNEEHMESEEYNDRVNTDNGDSSVVDEHEDEFLDAIYDFYEEEEDEELEEEEDYEVYDGDEEEPHIDDNDDDDYDDEEMLDLYTDANVTDG